MIPSFSEKFIEPVSNYEDLILYLLEREFDATQDELEDAKPLLEPYFSRFKDGSWIVVETNYIDKVYRNKYYKYFAGKGENYKRNCLRVSFFSREVDLKDFRELKNETDLKDSYLGFLVLRPTLPNIIGRNVLNPSAIKDIDIEICKTDVHSSSLGAKLVVNGFPHSGQDSEISSCAETTVWAIMEYFGNKYPEYHPVLPSKIIKVLSQISSERQLPSKGLPIAQISYCLKAFGFGTTIVNREDYNDNENLDFLNILRIYVDSGIPIVLAAQNGSDIAHALICIGFNTFSEENISNLKRNKTSGYYEFSDINRDVVVVDDNHPSYQQMDLKCPFGYYDQENWHQCKITHFVVPLYQKTYLDAIMAKKVAYGIVQDLSSRLPDLAEWRNLLIRTFLASTRSYRSYISLNEDIDKDLKEVFLEQVLPKFIWIVELSDKKIMGKKQAYGFLVLDSTSVTGDYLRPVKFGLVSSPERSQISRIVPEKSIFTLPLQPFKIYTNNLR